MRHKAVCLRITRHVLNALTGKVLQSLLIACRCSQSLTVLALECAPEDVVVHAACRIDPP